MSSDEAIQLTNNDASCFKSYAVQKGYWNDPYINYFSSKSFNDEHKPPEMSRGYFLRVNSMLSVVNNFLTINNRLCQIVNLGAGYDTLYFNLFDQQLLPTKYVEIDFQRIVSSKIRLIKSKKCLNEKVQSQMNVTPIENDLFKMPVASVPAIQHIITDNYCLIGADLRNLTELEKKLIECRLDTNLPT